MIDLVALGDRAWLARFGGEDEAAAWGRKVREERIIGVVEVVTAYRDVAVHADPARVDLDELGERLKGIEAEKGEAAVGRVLRVPVLYDGEDLGEVARVLGIGEREVVAEHTEGEYCVFAVGFLPGFPYAGYLPERWGRVRRLEAPRREVPAGAVGVAGRQTGIYPGASPGGWRLIGRTPLVIADPREGFFPIGPGDRLRFEAIGSREYKARKGERLGGAVPGTGPV